MDRIVVNGWALNSKTAQLQKGKKTCQLSNKSAALIELLYQAKGKTVSRESLLSLLWPETIVSDDSLTNLVSVTRQQLKDIELDKILKTVPKKGYRLEGEFSLSTKNGLFSWPILLSIFLFIVVVSFLLITGLSPEKPRLFIAPISSTENTKELTSKLENEFQHKLSQITQAIVISRDEVRSQASQSHSLATLAKSLNADYWLKTTVDSKEKVAELTFQFIAANDQSVVFSKKFEINLQKIDYSISAISNILNDNIYPILNPPQNDQLAMLSYRNCLNFIELTELYTDNVLYDFKKIANQGNAACELAEVNNEKNDEALYALVSWYTNAAIAMENNTEERQRYLTLATTANEKLKKTSKALFINSQILINLVRVKERKFPFASMEKILKENDLLLSNALTIEYDLFSDKAAAYSYGGAAYRHVAVVAKRLGKDPMSYFEKAIFLFEQGLGFDANSSVIFNNFARTKKSIAQYQIAKGIDPLPMLNESIDLFKQALLHEPNNLGVLNNAANTYATLTKWLAKKQQPFAYALDHSVDMYKQVLTINELSKKPYNNLSDLYAGVSRTGAKTPEDLMMWTEAGIKAATGAQLIDANYSSALLNLAKNLTLQLRHLVSTEDYDIEKGRACVSYYQKTLLQLPNIIQMHVKKAECEYFNSLYLFKKGLIEEAKASLINQLTWLRIPLEKNPKLASAYLQQVKAYMLFFRLSNDTAWLEKAEQAAMLSFEHRPNNPLVVAQVLITTWQMSQLSIAEFPSTKLSQLSNDLIKNREELHHIITDIFTDNVTITAIMKKDDKRVWLENIKIKPMPFYSNKMHQNIMQMELSLF